ncbi:MAG TPA: hypothetical protein VFV38_30480 [Ktedonobacteraceae bacterium]|nr:hypothetical protein [Ktedonobacteraceae bacterium]
MKTTTQNAWLRSAHLAGPKLKVKNRRIKMLWSSWQHSIMRILSVAWCEALLQTRSIVSWVMLAVFTLLTVLYARVQVSSSTIYLSNGQVAVTVCGYTASFVYFLLPFLYVNTFARDRQRKMHQLVWTRPQAAVEYALGKGLGAVGISMLLSWIPLVVGWLTASIARGEVQPVGLWLQMLLVVGAGAVLVTLFGLLCIVLTSPVGLLGALLTAGVVVYVDVVFAKSMLFLKNLTAITLFASPSIGFGPDSSLLLWQRLSYVVGGLCCLSLLALVYQLRERLGVAQFRHVLSTILLLSLTGSMLFASISTYQMVGASYTDPGLMSGKPVQAATTNYNVDVTADPASGDVQGSVSFTLTPQGKLGPGFIIGLNPGLHVRRVEALSTSGGDERALPFVETSAGWTRITVQGTNLANGLALNLHINYTGQMVLGRNDYAAPTGGYGQSNGISWSQNYFYLSFLGQGTGELLGTAGSWYPLPLTQQALDAGTRIPVEELHLRFPASFKVWSSLGNVVRTSDGKWQEIVAQPHAGLPEALAAVLSSAQQGSVRGLSFWHQGDLPDQMQLLTYWLSMKEAQALNLWLAPDSSSTAFQTVVVPILPFPVVGPGLLLLPETPGSNGLDFMNGSPYTPTAIARYTARQVARSWWLNAAFFPFTLLLGGLDTQNPDASTSVAPTNALLNMLSEYSAVVITDKTIGANFFTNEMQVCSEKYTLTSSGSSNAANSQQEEILRQEMIRLGTTCLSMELVPYRLSLTKGVGFARLTSFLQQYARAHTQQKTDMRQFLQQAGILASKDIIPEAAPYICPGGEKTTPAGGSADPLACLSENYSGT